MKAEKGKDGVWCAGGKGYLRPIATFASTRREARKLYAEVYQTQQSEEYHFCESMSHLAEISYGEGRDLG